MFKQSVQTLCSNIVFKHLFKHLLLVIAMTMALTPFLDVISTRIVSRLDGTKGLDMEEGLHGESEHHVLIAGFGRIGGIVALMLKNSENLTFFRILRFFFLFSFFLPDGRGDAIPRIKSQRHYTVG